MNFTQNDLADYQQFWNSSFPENIRNFYIDCYMTTKPWATILSSRHQNLRKILGIIYPENSKREFFFSVSMYYISVIPQIICKIVSPQAAGDFLRSSGWPAISLGMGGYMSAEQVLYESGLLPLFNEVNKYILLLDIVHPYHKQEVKDFLTRNSENLNPDAYKNLCDASKNHIQNVLDEMDRLLDYFKDICMQIKNAKSNHWNSYYLDINNTYK